MRFSIFVILLMIFITEVTPHGETDPNQKSIEQILTQLLKFEFFSGEEYTIEVVATQRQINFETKKLNQKYIIYFGKTYLDKLRKKLRSLDEWQQAIGLILAHELCHVYYNHFSKVRNYKNIHNRPELEIEAYEGAGIVHAMAGGEQSIINSILCVRDAEGLCESEEISSLHKAFLEYNQEMDNTIDLVEIHSEIGYKEMTKELMIKTEIEEGFKMIFLPCHLKINIIENNQVIGSTTKQIAFEDVGTVIEIGIKSTEIEYSKVRNYQIQLFLYSDIYNRQIWKSKLLSIDEIWNDTGTDLLKPLIEFIIKKKR